jgi:hypothetical protein
MFIEFDEEKLRSELERAPAKVAIAMLSDDVILAIAKDYNSNPWPRTFGRYNEAHGHAGYDGAGGVYKRDPYDGSGQFAATLELEIVGGALEFRSPAVKSRPKSSFAYGEAIIHGGGNFSGPYRLLPAEFYDGAT